MKTTKIKVQGDPGYWRQQHKRIAKQHKDAALVRESKIANNRCWQNNSGPKF
jgi:hypothetical protein